MKIHVISETPFIMKATGVHTAFIDHVKLLREKDDIEVIVNNEGTGDVCHGHTYGLYYFWKGRKYKGKRVFTVHVTPDSIKGSLPQWRLFMPFIKMGLKLVYSYSDVCIAISPAVEKAIIDTGTRTKIEKIYNPVHKDIWKRTLAGRTRGRKDLCLNDDEFVVLGVGQLAGRKGIDDFLDIADTMPGVKFVWAGGRPFGRFTEGISRINDKLHKAGKNFINAGQVRLEKMPDIYAAADLLLFPSYQENCPLAPIEAAASGMPVLFRDISEYRSLYENPYLRAGNNKEFVDLIRNLKEDKTFYDEGLRISEQLVEQFNKDHIRNKLIEVYTSLVRN